MLLVNQSLLVYCNFMKFPRVKVSEEPACICAFSVEHALPRIFIRLIRSFFFSFLMLFINMLVVTTKVGVRLVYILLLSSVFYVHE